MTQVEKLGIPTVSVCTEGFGVCGGCESSGRDFGIPNLAWAKAPVRGNTYEGIPYTVEAIEEVAPLVVPDIIKSLTTPLKQLQKEKTRAKIRTPGDPKTPSSETISFSGGEYDEILEKFQHDFDVWGLSGGMTVVPPTRRRFDDILKGTKHSPDEIVIPRLAGAGEATIKKIAINAVMAGCKPEHLPVVIAGLKAAVAANRNIETDTPGFIWLNGPIVKELGINYTVCPGPEAGAASRSNLAIGRAIFLCLQNIGGRWSKVMPVVTAENEEISPWPPFHVEKGYDKNVSTITAMCSAAKPIELYAGSVALGTGKSDETLYAISHSIRGLNLYPNYGALPAGLGQDALVILTAQMAGVIAHDGWTKANFKEYLWHNTGITMGDLRNAKAPQLNYWDYRNPWIKKLDNDVVIPPVGIADHFQVIVVGIKESFEAGWFLQGATNGYSATEVIDDWR